MANASSNFVQIHRIRTILQDSDLGAILACGGKGYMTHPSKCQTFRYLCSVLKMIDELDRRHVRYITLGNTPRLRLLQEPLLIGVGLSEAHGTRIHYVSTRCSVTIQPSISTSMCHKSGRPRRFN